MFKSVDDAKDFYFSGKDSGCCSCSVNHPCNYCMAGLSLPLDEFLDLCGFEEIKTEAAMRDGLTNEERPPEPEKKPDRICGEIRRTFRRPTADY